MGKKTDYGEFNFGKKLENLENACSNNDCTGAVPTPPKTEAEKESYKNVYEYEPVVFTKKEDKE